jgi:hypothetical protein
VLEIPVTVTQDYSLFHILGSYSTTLWEEQCRMILAGHGLISAIVHPDYIINKKSNNTYRRLLAHLSYLREKLFVWTALPGEINKWWRLRSQMTLVPDGAGWRIDGEGKERARIAYAHVVGGRLKYSFEPILTRTNGDQSLEFLGQPAVNTGLPHPSNSVSADTSKVT